MTKMVTVVPDIPSMPHHEHRDHVAMNAAIDRIAQSMPQKAGYPDPAVSVGYLLEIFNDELAKLDAAANADDGKRPDVTVEIHRYDDPDGWSFTHLTKCAWNDPGAEAPIFDRQDDVLQGADYMKMQWYRGRTEGLFYEPQAMMSRKALDDKGYRVLPWTDIKEGLKAFIIHNICPLEWQSSMDKGDTDLLDRVAVWVKF